MLLKIKGKRVTVPKHSVSEGETNVDEIRLVTERYYDNVDLQSLNAFLNIERSDLTTDCILLEKSIVGETLTLNCDVTERMTRVSGFIRAQLVMSDENSAVVFRSDSFKLHVGDSVNCLENDSDELPSAMVQLRNELTGLVLQASQQCAACETAIETLNTNVSGLVPKSRTVNGKSLETDISLIKSDVGLSNAVNLDTSVANNITSGTLPDERLSQNIARSSEIPVVTQSDWNEDSPSCVNYILNKPTEISETEILNLF